MNSPLTRVVVVLIESGLLYTFSIIILFGLYMASNNGQYGVSDAVSNYLPFWHAQLMLPRLYIGRPNHREQPYFFASAVLLTLSFRVSHSTWLSQVWIVPTHSNPPCLPAHTSATKPRMDMFRCTWSTFKRPSPGIQIQLPASRQLNLQTQMRRSPLDGRSHDDGHLIAAIIPLSSVPCSWLLWRS